jgi:hypothetical protein
MQKYKKCSTPPSFLVTIILGVSVSSDPYAYLAK